MKVLSPFSSHVLSGSWLVLLGFLGSLFFSGPALGKSKKSSKRGKYRIYVVQPGDSCWSIARRLFGNGRKYTIIHRYNKLGPMPHILKPGQQLRLPGSLISPDARVSWLLRRVQAKPPRAVDWYKARKDMGLWRLYKVRTGHRSAARIRFEDDSSLRLRGLALLVIYGSTAQKVRRQRRVKHKVQVRKGIVRGGLASLDRAAEMKIQTPASEIRLRSREAQVEVDQVESSIVSVYDGQALVRAQGKEVKVPRDFGTYVKKGKRPARPRRLPSRPRWEKGVRQAVLFAPQGYRGQFEARWKPVKGAQRYRVEFSRDRRFRRVLVDAVVGAGILRFRARRLLPGSYYARVSAISPHKLEGRPSATLHLQIFPLKTSRRLQKEKTPQGRLYKTVGFLQLQPPPRMAQTILYSENNGAFRPLKGSLPLSRPGLHRLRFRLQGEGSATSTLRFRLLAVRGRLQVKPSRLNPQGRPARIRLELRDEEGQPVSLPELTLRRQPGKKIPLRYKKPGLYEATLAIPAQPSLRSVILLASWAGGDLARAQVEIESPAPRRRRPVVLGRALPVRPAFSWPDVPVAMEWAKGVPGLPSRAARPSTYLGLTSFLSQLNQLSPTDPAFRTRAHFLRIALRGQLAFWRERFGLDLDLPWLQLDLDNDTAQRSKLGDLRVGARFVAWQGGGLRLSPSLRLTLPTGGFRLSTTPRDAYFEPALLLGWEATSWLTLGSNQVLAVGSDFANHHSLYYSSSYGAEIRLWRILTFAIELQMAIRAFQSTDLAQEAVALALSGALRLHLGRLRLGLVGGGALNKGGSDLFGGYSIGLTLDLGYRFPF